MLQIWFLNQVHTPRETTHTTHTIVRIRLRSNDVAKLAGSIITCGNDVGAEFLHVIELGNKERSRITVNWAILAIDQIRQVRQIACLSRNKYTCTPIIVNELHNQNTQRAQRSRKKERNLANCLAQIVLCAISRGKNVTTQIGKMKHHKALMNLIPSQDLALRVESTVKHQRS